MTDLIPVTQLDKEHLLKESKSFCMMPWVHVYQSPVGDHGPCCIAGTGDVMRTDNLMDLVNSERMKQVRKDMLNGVMNDTCKNCHNHEAMMGHSARISNNQCYEHAFEDALQYTREDGSLDEFKMRYFDIRFSNICNFKCRSCGPGFSSQWAAEIKKNDIPADKTNGSVIKVVGNSLLDDVLDQIDNFERVYFAGGEPLIDDNHYIILNELIYSGKTDVVLMYNTNLSNLNYKNHDIIDLWSKFDHPVDVVASIDHTQSRAEYIRHGTEWPVVLDNLLKVKEVENVRLSLNCVVTNLNYVSLSDIVLDLFDSGLYTPGDDYRYVRTGFYPATDPAHLSPQAMPKGLKVQARKNLEDLFHKLVYKGYHDEHLINTANQIMDVAESANTWEDQKDRFQELTMYYDEVRKEDFYDTFPELEVMMYE